MLYKLVFVVLSQYLTVVREADHLWGEKKSIVILIVFI